jgi:hypothetical protein
MKKMSRHIAAIGKLLPWKEADLERWWKDADSGPLERKWDIRAPCPHTENVMASQCCGAEPQENSIGHCGQCGEGTGFDLICIKCREPVERTL